jgi:hypothetical protein
MVPEPHGTDAKIISCVSLLIGTGLCCEWNREDLVSPLDGSSGDLHVYCVKYDEEDPDSGRTFVVF